MQLSGFYSMVEVEAAEAAEAAEAGSVVTDPEVDPQQSKKDPPEPQPQQRKTIQATQYSTGRPQQISNTTTERNMQLA